MNGSYRIPTPQIDFAPPVYVCKRATKPHVLDGKIFKDFWADVPFTDDFLDIEGSTKPIPRFRTRAKMQWDDEYLYIAALLEGPEIWATITQRDSVIFYDNDFEIFIDPDSDTQQYIEFEMNALNTVWDLLLTKAYHDGGLPIDDFDLHGIKSAVFIDGKLNEVSKENHYWSCEVLIPFKSIYAVAKEHRIPKNGEYYRMNFSRVHWQVEEKNGTYVKKINSATNKAFPEDNWVWSPTGIINIHYPELWGFVFFADEKHSNETFTIPKKEQELYVLRQVYYKQHQFFDDHGAFAKSLEELGCSKIPNNIVLETTSDFFQVSYTTDLAKYVLFADGKTEIR